MDNLTVRYQAVNGQTRTPLLVNGTVDLVCATTTNTFSRQKQLDFLNTMFVTGNRLLVKKGAGIKEIEDLKGKVGSANQGTTNEKVLNELNEKLNLGIKVLPTKDQPQAWIALGTGRTDAHMTDEVVEYGLIAKSKDPQNYEVVGRLLSFDPYAHRHPPRRLGFPHARQLQARQALSQRRVGKIYTKWMSTISQPLSLALKDLMSMQNYPVDRAGNRHRQAKATCAYNWDWSVLITSPYLGWILSGLGWTILVSLAGLDHRAQARLGDRHPAHAALAHGGQSARLCRDFPQRPAAGADLPVLLRAAGSACRRPSARWMKRDMPTPSSPSRW